MKSSEQKPQTLRAIILEPIYLQAILWLLSAFVTDGGEMNIWMTRAIMAFWPVAFLIVLRRHDKFTPIDRIYLRWGFPIIAGVYVVFGSTIYFLIHGLIDRYTT